MALSICEQCGRTFQVRPSRQAQGKGRFCSRQCYFDAKRRYSFSKICEHCGKMFYTKKDTARYCSRLCAGKGRMVELGAASGGADLVFEKGLLRHYASGSFEDPWRSGAIPPDYYGPDNYRMPDIWLGF